MFFKYKFAINKLNGLHCKNQKTLFYKNQETKLTNKFYFRFK